MATIRQKRAVKKLVENGGNVSKAMIEGGYTPATANTPQKLTNSKGFQELMAEIIPDSLLVDKHLELLNKREKYIVEHKNKDGSDVYEVSDEPETLAVSKGLDMAYKLKGSYAPEKTASLNVNIGGQNLQNPEIDALQKEFEEKIRIKLSSETK